MKKFWPYALIILVLLVAGGIYIDRSSKGSMLLPAQSNNSNSTTMPNIDFQNLGPAPDFTGISNWLNSQPLKIADLRGKVVLIDFWTYSCINCIRTLPYVTKWSDTYQDKGLIVIGVHTPEFAFEKVTANVANAIQQYKIHYPVAQDNDYGTWNAYNNEYWPAEYLINKQGDIVYTHFGEGEYDRTEDAIRQLLGLSGAVAADNGQDLSAVGSPEMYFGTGRLQYLTTSEQPSATPKNYQAPAQLALNNFALDGTWKFEPDKAVLTSSSGKIRLHFDSAKVNLVGDAAMPQNPVDVTVLIDGKKVNQLKIQAAQLYNLFNSNDYRQHDLELDINGSGFEAFTFTFG